MKNKNKNNLEVPEEFLRFLVLGVLNEVYPEPLEFKEIDSLFKDIDYPQKRCIRIIEYFNEKKYIHIKSLTSLRITAEGIDYFEILKKKMTQEISENLRELFREKIGFQV